jgi:hypothetical protein
MEELTSVGLGRGILFRAKYWLVVLANSTKTVDSLSGISVS